MRSALWIRSGLPSITVHAVKFRAPTFGTLQLQAASEFLKACPEVPTKEKGAIQMASSQGIDGVRDRARFLIPVLILALAGLYLVTAQSAKALTAEQFCQGAVVGYYGGPNDYCSAPNFHYVHYVEGYGWNHSVCASSTTNRAKSGVNVAWACTSGPNTYVINTVNASAWTVGIVRNNTTGDSTTIRGTQWW